MIIYKITFILSVIFYNIYTYEFNNFTKIHVLCKGNNRFSFNELYRRQYFSVHVRLTA